jgi:hypothetical protein
MYLQFGNPVFPAFGAMRAGISLSPCDFDSVIALWFLAGAPSSLRQPQVTMRAAGA